MVLEDCIGFEWDLGNFTKNWDKHKVSHGECEQVFFNKPLLFYEDKKHSDCEARFCLLGRSDSERTLFVIFTIRNNLVRVISARNMNKKERVIYEKAQENTEV